MSVSEEFIRELKYKNNITDVISTYVDIKQKGKNFVGLCPFHSEKTASFFIYPSNESFYCFGCGKGGDVITFVRLIEKLDYIESLKFLCQRSHMEFPDDAFTDSTYKQKIKIYEINRASAKFFHNNLCDSKSKIAMDYIKKRNISWKFVRRFGIGYSPVNKVTLVEFLKNLGYSQDDILASNMAYKNRFGKIIDRFSNRIMFPIINVRGNVVGFGGRSIDGSNPKYLNTSDTIVFKKSENVFAMNFAKGSNLKGIILTEGYMDTIALHSIGFTNTVASLGTALTDEQVRLISKYANEVVICLDSDSAGQTAVLRAINILRKNGMTSKVVRVPNGKDPDEFIRYYRDESPVRFKDLINNAVTDVEYQLSVARDKYILYDTADKIKYTSEAVRILSKIENDVEKDIYCGKISQEIGVSKESVKEQIKKYVRSKSRKENFSKKVFFDSYIDDGKNDYKDISPKRVKAEETILSYIASNYGGNDVLTQISEDLFEIKFNKKLYLTLKMLILNNKNIDLNNILSEGFSDVEDSGKITRIICSYEREYMSKEIIEECIRLIKYENQKAKIMDVQDVSTEELKCYISTLKKMKQ